MENKKPILVIRLILMVSFLVLLVRLIELQIIKGAYYRDLADGNRIRVVELKAPRGEITARGGELLVTNQPLNLAVYYSQDKGYFTAISEDDKEKIADISGYTRYYPLKESAGHITGYVGLVSDKESEKIDSSCVEKGQRKGSDQTGRSGLEEYYDCQLRGVDGEKLLEVGADGSFIRELGEKVPLKGNDLVTTIDYPLQEYVSTLLPKVKGVIIVGDPHGEILALYSSPGYDPNIFQNGGGEIGKILEDKSLPLFNRALSGRYSPGSIFKPIVAIAALETGSIDKNYHYQDTGSIRFSTPYGNYSFSNWYFTQYGGTEGTIEVTRALARSTDTFFYKIGELTGIDKIKEWSDNFGLSKKTGIDIPGEIEGLVPDPTWKEKTTGERWYLGNTYNTSIGQGDLAITPIEIHTAITAIAAEGSLCTPHLVNGNNLNGQANKGSGCRDLGIRTENINLVKDGMKKVCSTGGTGYTFFDFKGKFGIDVACKTGTAQIGSKDKTNAWFTAYAPVEDPEIIVTVLVEEGGEGSKVAGPIARNIFDFWFKDKLTVQNRKVNQ